MFGFFSSLFSFFVVNDVMFLIIVCCFFDSLFVVVFGFLLF